MARKRWHIWKPSMHAGKTDVSSFAEGLQDLMVSLAYDWQHKWTTGFAAYCTTKLSNKPGCSFTVSPSFSTHHFLEKISAVCSKKALLVQDVRAPKPRVQHSVWPLFSVSPGSSPDLCPHGLWDVSKYFFPLLNNFITWALRSTKLWPQNHRMIWVVREFKEQVVLTPFPWVETLDQAISNLALNRDGQNNTPAFTQYLWQGC